MSNQPEPPMSNQILIPREVLTNLWNGLDWCMWCILHQDRFPDGEYWNKNIARYQGALEKALPYFNAEVHRLGTLEQLPPAAGQPEGETTGGDWERAQTWATDRWGPVGRMLCELRNRVEDLEGAENDRRFSDCNQLLDNVTGQLNQILDTHKTATKGENG